MKMLKEDDIHLRFLLNSPIHVEGIGNFFAPSLKDVIELTESDYNTGLYSVMIDRNSLEKLPEDIEQYTDFQVLSSIIYHDVNFREAFFCVLNLHFNKYPDMHENGHIYFDELSEDTILTEEKFNYIKKLIRIANNLQVEEEEFSAGNDAAKKFIEAQKKKRAELAKHKKAKTNLHSIISAVGWKSQAFDFICNLNIYQLYNGYARLQVLDNYNYTMSGMYAGTVDGTKIKIEDINWINII